MPNCHYNDTLMDRIANYERDKVVKDRINAT